MHYFEHALVRVVRSAKTGTSKQVELEMLHSPRPECACCYDIVLDRAGNRPMVDSVLTVLPLVLAVMLSDEPGRVGKNRTEFNDVQMRYQSAPDVPPRMVSYRLRSVVIKCKTAHYITAVRCPGQPFWILKNDSLRGKVVTEEQLGGMNVRL